MEFMSENEYNTHVKRVGIKDQFIEHGSISELYRLCGMDAISIAKVIAESIGTKSREVSANGQVAPYNQPYISTINS